MIWGRARSLRIPTERMILRPPEMRDYAQWRDLRRGSHEFLQPWEPVRPGDPTSRRAFAARLRWNKRALADGREVPLLLVRRSDEALLGGITLSNIRRGPSMAASTGYWMGQPHIRQGYMREAVIAVVHYAFTKLDLSRLEAGCLAENTPSRSLLESCGYKYEGVAQAYLQINGRWQNHVLYANLRSDRRGRAA